jgi:hypothetical protein
MAAPSPSNLSPETPSPEIRSPEIRSAARRTRLAVTLGAAVAILAAALLGTDMRSSFAEGGLMEFFFSDAAHHRRIIEPLSYGRGAGYYYGVRRRAALHHRSHRRVAHHGARGWRSSAQARGGHMLLARRAAGSPELAASASGRRFVCVRSCDGYSFPLPATTRRSHAARQAACENACPGAATQVYAIPAGSEKIQDAVSMASGRLYADLAARFASSAKSASSKTASCACNSAADASPAARPATTTVASYLDDPTLRPGDTVVTPQGVRVVRSGSHYPFKHTDFLSLAETRDVSTEKRGALAAIERMLKTPHGRAVAAPASARRDAPKLN